MPESNFSITVLKRTPSYYRVRIGDERFSLNLEEIEELLREIKSSKPDEPTPDPKLTTEELDISADIEDISLETERQMLLLIERLSEIRGVGEVRATEVMELLIKEGLTDVSRRDLEEIGWNQDTLEKVWLYLLGLRDSVNREFMSE